MKRIYLLACLYFLFLNVQSQVTDTGDKVGIGVASPSQKLEIDGNVKISQSLIVGSEIKSTNGFIDLKPTQSSYGVLVREFNSTDWGNLKVTSTGFGLSYMSNEPQAYVNSNGDFVLTESLKSTKGHVDIKPTQSNYGVLVREYNSTDWGNLKVTSTGFGLSYMSAEPQAYVNSDGDFVLTESLKSTKGHVDIKPTQSNYGVLVREYNSTDWGNLKVTPTGFGLSYMSAEPQAYVNSDGDFVLTESLKSTKGHVDIQPTQSSYGVLVREFNSTDWGNLKVTSTGFGLSYMSAEPQAYVNSDGDFVLTESLKSTKGHVDIKPTQSNYGVLVREYNSTDWGNLKVTPNGFGLSYMSSDPQAYVNSDGDFVLTNNLQVNNTINASEILINGNPISTTSSSLWSKEGNDLVYSAGGAVVGDIQLPTGYSFAVDGKAIMEEVKVELSEGWPDFVFEGNYELRTLREVENYITENKHLPEMPSEVEVTENGINLGEMDAKLLQKIEELTLYMIDINKRVGELEEENGELKREMAVLKKE